MDGVGESIGAVYNRKGGVGFGGIGEGARPSQGTRSKSLLKAPTTSACVRQRTSLWTRSGSLGVSSAGICAMRGSNLIPVRLQ